MATSSYTSIEHVDGVAVARITLEKVTDRESQPVLQEITSAATAGGYRVAIDLSPVLLLASAGIGVLVSINKLCKGGGGGMCVFGVGEEILKVLKVTNLHRLVTIVDSREEALKRLRP